MRPAVGHGKMRTMVDRTLRHDGAAWRAHLDVPGDKSLSHRALIFAAMAKGRSEVDGLGTGADIAATQAALSRFGVTIDAGSVHSAGVESWRQADGPIDAGNSGTTLRLLAGALAGRPFRSTLGGDDSLNRRPMRRLVDPLQALGATVETSDGTPPVSVGAPIAGLRGAAVDLPVASAQVRTAFALAALQADGSSQIDSPPGYRDHTERWLLAMGLGSAVDETGFEVHPGLIPTAIYNVPGDPSSAAFLWAAAAMRPASEVVTPGVSLNPGRIGFLDVLRDMGAEIDINPTRDVHGDPAGDVAVRGRSLGGTKVAGRRTVEAMDELPLVAVVAAAGEGTTVIQDAAELRGKESDRIATTVAMITALGGVAEEHQDGFTVVGSGGYAGGTVASNDDHRIAMAAAVSATAARGEVVVVGSEAASVSWPGFYEVLEQAWSSR